MPEFSLFAGNQPAVVNVGDNGATFTNYGPSLVYYAGSKVSSTSYDGSLTAGASVTLYGSPHFTIDRQQAGGVRADVMYTSLPVADSNDAPSKSSAVAPGTAVAVATTSTAVVAADTTRNLVVLTNDSDTTIYLRFAASGAVVSQGIRLNANGGTLVVPPEYRGAICAIHGASGTKNLTVSGV